MFEQFIREKRLLLGVSPATISWYEQSLKHLGTETPTEPDLKSFVMGLRERNLKVAGVNCKIRAVNSFLGWAKSPHRIPRVKEPQIILPTFTAAQVKLLIGWKARTFCQKRLHLMVLALLDTGARISEILNLHVNEIDLDNCLVTLDGKGQKQRKVPISFELRKAVFRYTTDLELEGQDYLLGTRKGGKLE